MSYIKLLLFKINDFLGKLLTVQIDTNYSGERVLGISTLLFALWLYKFDIPKNIGPIVIIYQVLEQLIPIKYYVIILIILSLLLFIGIMIENYDILLSYLIRRLASFWCTVFWLLVSLLWLMDNHNWLVIPCSLVFTFEGAITYWSYGRRLNILFSKLKQSNIDKALKEL